MKLSIVTPTFNESPNIVPLISSLRGALGEIDYEILVVDDNSPDLTWSIAEGMSSADPRIRVLRRMQNPGLGAAVIDGFRAARGEAVACIDADLQHDPSILPQMLAVLSRGSAVVVGSRYVAGGGTQRWSMVRRLESWIATKVAQLVLGVKLKDPMSGYFMLWRRDFCAVQNDLNGNGFKILLEILARLRPSAVKEVPYTFGPRSAGQSKLSGRVVLEYLKQVCRLFAIGRQFPERFIKFSIVGGLGVVVNLAIMALLIGPGRVQDWRASAMASLAANLHNYVLNNLWTFSERSHRGRQLLVKGYFSYLSMSALGLAITTAVYAGLTWGLTRFLQLPPQLPGSIEPIRLVCQLVAILLGLVANYELNKTITWPEEGNMGFQRVIEKLKRKVSVKEFHRSAKGAEGREA
jgi:dolichol-phosphate mannosyltransferase